MDLYFELFLSDAAVIAICAACLIATIAGIIHRKK